MKEYPKSNEDDITYKFFDIDSDADGLITFEETAAYFASNGGKAILMQTPGWSCSYKCPLWFYCVIKNKIRGNFARCGAGPAGCKCL